MKKASIPVLVIVALMVISAFSYKHSMTFRRHKYESFLKTKYRDIVPQQAAKHIPEADEPAMAALQEYFKTFDPATGKIPRDRLLKAYSQTLSDQQMKSGSSDIHWTGYQANMGGRTRALMYDPNDANHRKVWAGGVTGGLWYNTNITSAGSQWVPVGDFWSCLAIRCLAYDPNNTQIFYLGTGEPETALITYRESCGLGNGIWKSTDGGQTWNVLPSTMNFAFISKIIVRNEGGNSVIYAGVVSGVYHGIHQSQPTDGLFRSMDGGTTWTQVLPNIQGQNVPYSPSDVVINSNGRIFVGTMPNLENKGAATILFSDAGTSGTWNVNSTYNNEIQNDTANTIPGRVVLGCTPANPNVVYALIAQGYTSLYNGFNYFYCYRIYRSDDQGANWTRKTIPPDANGQVNFAYLSWHALDIAVDPNDADNVFIGGLDIQKTADGGNSWDRVTDWSLMYYGGGPQYVHGDQHIMVFKPGSSDEMIMGCDGGVFYTSNASSAMPTFSEHNTNYNTLQFYTGAIHPAAGTNQFLGGLQDNGTLLYSGTPLDIFSMVSGGDGAYCFYDKFDPAYFLTSIYYNQYITFYENYPQNYISDFYGSGVFVNPADYDYKFGTLYANACTFGGDFTDYLLRINDVMTFGYYGDYIPANTGAQVYFSALKWSPMSTTSNTILYAGTQAGQLFRIQHAESTPVATEITGTTFPVAGISSIDLHGSEDTLLVTFSNYGIPSVFVSYNGGQTWLDREGNLPDMPVRWAIFHPDNSRQVMLATETGTWTTTNMNQANVTWTPQVSGMANVRVDMLSMRESDNTVLAATHGRGFFTTTWDVVEATNELSNNPFVIYPNPATDIVNISYPAAGIKEITVRIFDQAGRIVFEESKYPSGGNWTTRVSLNGKAAGIYYVTLYREGQKLKTEKIIRN